MYVSTWLETNYSGVVILMKSKILFILISFLSISLVKAEPIIQANQSQSYLGKYVTACGVLADFKHFRKVHMFNLDKPYPNHSLTIAIFNNDYNLIRQYLGGDLEQYINQRICATGVIKRYKGKNEIIVKSPMNLRIGQ